MDDHIIIVVCRYLYVCVIRHFLRATSSSSPVRSLPAAVEHPAVCLSHDPYRSSGAHKSRRKVWRHARASRAALSTIRRRVVPAVVENTSAGPGGGGERASYIIITCRHSNALCAVRDEKARSPLRETTCGFRDEKEKKKTHNAYGYNIICTLRAYTILSYTNVRII